MPLYEYHCATCNTRTERLRPMGAAEEETPCPACGGVARRTLSTFSAFTAGEGGTRAVGGACAGCAGGSCSACAN